MKLATALALSGAMGLATVPVTASAYFGEPGTWASGWGQGVSEYMAVSEDASAELYIACSEVNPVSMTLTVDGVTYGNDQQGEFNLILDDHEVSSPHFTNSRVHADNFLYAWERMRKANSIMAVTSDGQRVELPSSGSAKALPSANSQEMSCKTAFYSF
ncbi:hypothetical protein [Vreelandella arcis]|uniref:Uncharacterized protein n=1 Tax=Vreelandella arcis TaxID=416873 RepID=A0A1H0CRQ8_9GAMM|nr:hypothetical protein [Halomonas arcis]SDN60582.1 hypothetical protein SAMN04487951_106172 [Halomonas arcis]